MNLINFINTTILYLICQNFYINYFMLVVNKAKYNNFAFKLKSFMNFNFKSFSAVKQRTLK